MILSILWLVGIVACGYIYLKQIWDNPVHPHEWTVKYLYGDRNDE